MNFLAHLHLASLANSSFLGNLMADFVRGTPEEQYSAPVAAGIRLHRRIDTLTDSHPLVREARQLFRPNTAATRRSRWMWSGIIFFPCTGLSLNRKRR